MRPRSLTQMLVLPLTALVVLVAVVSGILRVRAVERGYHETLIAGADQLSLGLAASIWHSMLADDRPAAYDTMRKVARQPGISRIRIINKEGRIVFSTGPEAGRLVDKNAEACVLCHAGSQPLAHVETPSRARVFAGPEGRRLAMVTPVYNEPSCSTAACHAHPAAQRVLGVLDVALDLAPVDLRIAASRRSILLSTGLEVLLISGLLAVFIAMLVTRPINHLIEANTALGRMELEHPVEIASSREMWELAGSFTAMRDRLGDALARLNRASLELEAKVAERTEQLRQAHQHLLQAERLASLGRLAASVAHEIEVPLAGVLNCSSLMGRLLKEDGVARDRVPEFRGLLDRASDQTARAGRIVADLLAFSRQAKPHPAPADLNAIVSRTLSLVSHKLKRMNLEVETRLDQALPPFSCDPTQIQQVVLNLVMNAAQAPRRDQRGRVVVTTSRSDLPGVLALAVEDDGEGIPPEALDRIFDPFFTIKEEEGRNLGLGLAVVYGIVESHGGHVEVQSQLGVGTTLTVTLPLAPAVKAADQDTAAPETRPA